MAVASVLGRAAWGNSSWDAGGVAVAIASDGLTLSEILAAAITLTGSVEDGLVLADALSAALSLSPAAADGLKLAEALTPDMALSLALADGMTLADAVALAVSLSAIASDGLTWLDELNKIYLWLEEGVDLGDATRVRLPYLYKPGHRKGAYTLGKLHGKHELGTIQKGYGLGG